MICESLKDHFYRKVRNAYTLDNFLKAATVAQELLSATAVTKELRRISSQFRDCGLTAYDLFPAEYTINPYRDPTVPPHPFGEMMAAFALRFR